MKKITWKQALRDALVSAGFLGLAVLISGLLSQLHNDSNPFAPSLFILAVALVARFTTGYVWGFIASAVSVICVNYIFTYPFLEFNFSISGYPLTFACMLLVSVLISTLTTQIKKQEQLRFEMEREKMRADLLRSVSHDLRTPLTSMLGASSVLMEDANLSDADRMDLAREINKDARWLVRMTENILSVTKFSGEGVKLKKEAEVVEEVLGSAIGKFRKNYGDIPINVDKPDEILVTDMDATLIEQVLINLLENAVMHGRTTTQIDVRIARERGRVRVTVEDDGAGFAPQQLPHAFDGQSSVREGDHPDGRRNMGIGLSACRAILHAHGGDIQAYNRKSGGAGVSFWLPDEEDAYGE